MRRTAHGVEQMQELGRRVRSLRETAGLSQEKLAELAGMHRTYVGHVERGEVNPTVWNLIRLAAVLAVDVSALVEGLRP